MDVCGSEIADEIVREGSLKRYLIALVVLLSRKLFLMSNRISKPFEQ